MSEHPYTTPLLFHAHGTADAVKAGTKDVTRRAAWDLRPPRWRVGALSRCYRRSPRAGGRPFGEARILSVRRESLAAITPEEVAREGFPGLGVDGFLALFRELHKREVPDVWRIEFRFERSYEATPAR